MTFKQLKQIISKHGFDGVVIGGHFKHVYSFAYDKRDLFYNAFLEDTTFDNNVVLGIEPHYGEDCWYADTYLYVNLGGEEK